MPHIQPPTAQTRHWEHARFYGRRIGSPNDVGTEDEFLRHWGVLYQPFASAEDAKSLRRAEKAMDCNIVIKGELVDRFFYDSPAGAYVQTDARVVAALQWYLTANPKQSELDKTENMKLVRSRMVGTSLFNGLFTVTELPAVRASE